MELKTILLPEAVRASVKVKSKKRLLQDISDHAAMLIGVPSDQIFRALMDREILGPTGVGKGVAIPHARLPELTTVFGLFLSLDTPVEYDSIDRKPVDLVFTLLAPKGAGAEHLKALARVSRMLRNEAVCTKLRSTHENAALYAVLTEEVAERAA